MALYSHSLVVLGPIFNLSAMLVPEKIEFQRMDLLAYLGSHEKMRKMTFLRYFLYGLFPKFITWAFLTESSVSLSGC